MRSPRDPVAGSNTPIYDALYSEYRRLFRALPGDRSGEEKFQFHRLRPRPGSPSRTTASRPRTAPGGTATTCPAALPPGPAAAHDNRMRGI